MKIAFLGNSGSIQGLEGSNTALAVCEEGSLIVVDASGSPAEALTRSGLDPLDIDLVLLTHAHVDHIYALPSLIHNLYLMGRKRGLDIAANSATLEIARSLVNAFALPLKKGIFPIAFIDLGEGSLDAGPIHVQSFAVNHGIPTNGFTFTCMGRKLTYMADCNASTPIPACSIGSDALVHEACLGFKADHSSPSEAAECASAMKAGKLFLVHLPQDRQQRAKILDEAKAAFPESTIPEIMEQIEI